MNSTYCYILTGELLDLTPVTEWAPFWGCAQAHNFESVESQESSEESQFITSSIFWSSLLLNFQADQFRCKDDSCISLEQR